MVTIPLFIGFQHVSTIQGGAGFLPSSILYLFDDITIYGRDLLVRLRHVETYERP